jgi:hypothetical protein
MAAFSCTKEQVTDLYTNNKTGVVTETFSHYICSEYIFEASYLVYIIFVFLQDITFLSCFTVSSLETSFQNTKIDVKQMTIV